MDALLAFLTLAFVIAIAGFFSAWRGRRRGMNNEQGPRP